MNSEDKKPKDLVETFILTLDDLNSLFSDKCCVLWVRHYVSLIVCEQLHNFLCQAATEPYTHEIRSGGKTELQYFGVNRYGYPLNSTYNDDTGDNMKRYQSEAQHTMRSIRKAAEPYLSPIDKFRVEVDEIWPFKVGGGVINGQKTLTGIGRIMPANLSGMSELQPHFDSAPQSYFPRIDKQFAANVYLNVPTEGGELEAWNVPPIPIDAVKDFVTPDDWRAELPSSFKLKPERGDLLVFNTRRPHAITRFESEEPRTSMQTFFGLTKEKDLFFWV